VAASAVELLVAAWVVELLVAVWAVDQEVHLDNQTKSLNISNLNIKKEKALNLVPFL
jgi:hypothetical protein